MKRPAVCGPCRFWRRPLLAQGYHRKDGRIVKECDDLLSATRYGLMMLRYARTSEQSGRRRTVQAEGVDYDLFNHTSSRQSRRDQRIRIADDADFEMFR